MNAWLNEITGKSVTFKGNYWDKQGVGTGFALDNQCFIFQCAITGEFTGERGPACLSFLCLVLIRGFLKPPQHLHTHQVPLTISSPLPVYSTTSPFFQNLISSLPPPRGLPTSARLPPTPLAHRTVFVPALLCVFLYNHALIHLYCICN